MFTVSTLILEAECRFEIDSVILKRKLGAHQDSVLNPSLLVIVLEALSQEFRTKVLVVTVC